MSANAVHVGIAGLGRSGWDIHAQTLGRLKSSYRVVAVTDSQPDRCREAAQALACRAHDDFSALLADPEVELVVIATPSHLHAAQVTEALGKGKHVVCEKPMALSSSEADGMIQAAGRAGRVLTVFHNMRYWADFAKVRGVIESGKLGQVLQIRLTLHRFTRRWDWQTVRAFGGGALFNAGAHLVDLALQLFGPADPLITVDLRRALASGDAEDHAKILLRDPRSGGAPTENRDGSYFPSEKNRDGSYFSVAEGSAGRDAPRAPTIDIEITNACAFPQETWHVMGTAGGLRGTPRQLWWKWIDPSALPDRPLDASTAAAGRQFNREELPWQEETWVNEAPEERAYELFYEDLYSSIREGAPLVITPQSVRRILSVLERCRAAATAPA